MRLGTLTGLILALIAAPALAGQPVTINNAGNSQAANVTNGSLNVTFGASTACTPYHLPGGSAASTNSTLIATGARTLCALSVINNNGTIYFLRVYDSASAPTCSSATGAAHSYSIPANTSGAGIVLSFPLGEAYASGLGFCITGGGGDTDNTSATTGIYVNASYK